MSCITYINNDANGVPVTVSGTTCGGVVGNFMVNSGQAICMDNDFEIITCGNADIGAECLPPVTPTQTPSQTTTPTPSVTFGLTPTPTPSPTNTQTPTITPSPTITPTSTQICFDCYQYSYTATTSGIFTFTMCDGTVEGDSLSEGGTATVNCSTFSGGGIRDGQISGPGIIVRGAPCSICPTSTPTPTPTSTPTSTPQVTPTNTNTPTQTNTPTCGTFTTQYMQSSQQGNKDIRFTLFDNPDFTGNANALCDYTITGTFNIDGGAINQPYTTIMVNNDHNHTYDTGSNITGFTISSVVPVCPCVNVVFNQITPTPTSTANTTPTPTGTQPVTPTITATPSSTPPCPNTIYTHGALRGTCSDYCNNNYNITVQDCSSEPYSTLTIGDFIYGYSGQSGFLAYSNVSTDTSTGPFLIADIDGSGEILGIYVCSGGSCIPQ